MSILILQHSNNGGPGRLGACLRDHGFRFDIRRPDLGGKANAIPADLDNIHGVVILGGPMMVADTDKHPWLADEVGLIKLAHTAKLPIIGICLGAQLIAHALGGKVDWRETPAAGFLPTNVTIPGQTDTIMAGISWRHQQFYTCSQSVTAVPPGTTVLATAHGTPFAAFRLGLRTLAFQYHFECDQPMIEALGKEPCGKPGGQSVCLSSGELKSQIDCDYANYARLSDRLCVNIATYCFPVRQRMSA
ncbi:MAG: type 1 glutamine amidotransferase [Planctomycetes bacterium]|nr:type 1 glutamine amidotransferase [Planctomycetota bacterium]